MHTRKIIKGYNGIIDLDLTDVEKSLHKLMIDQHYKDIDDYKIEQSKLEPELRYENTVAIALKKIQYENKKNYERHLAIKKDQHERDKKLYEKYLQSLK